MPEFNLEDYVEDNLLRKDGQVSHGLNLVLRLAQPSRMCELLLRLLDAQPRIQQALDELHFVHFARFLPSRDGSALMVITEFDGPLEPYVMDFAIAIGEEFDMMLSYVDAADKPPPGPVKDHPEAFWDFVRQNNRVHIGAFPLPEWVDYPLYSAYRKLTVLDIVGPRTRLPPPVQDRAAADVDDDDVQGNILRGYKAKAARHFMLEIVDAAAARAWFALLAQGPQGAVPGIASNAPWPGAKPPPVLLNLGFTHEGLKALRIHPNDLRLFPAAFREGPAFRAKANGDTEDSAPAHWRLGRPLDTAGRQAEHAMLSLYAEQAGSADFTQASAAIVLALPGAGLKLLSTQDTTALGANGDETYFGYRDGIAQPRIATRCPEPKDMQPAASPGEFLLGENYQDIFGGKSIGQLPPALARNGSFCAVRVLQQHLDAFEKVLEQGADRAHLPGKPRKEVKELIAAKLMGRWQDGTPLALVPDLDTKKAATAADRESNAFDYAPSYEYPDTFHDHEGQRCPIGAHIRRANPRTSRVAGVRYSRRLIRRGMPYHLPAAGGPPEEQGLFGLFLCGSLERQFEFIQQQWLNGDVFASGLRGTRDPIAGSGGPGAEFLLPGMGPGGSTVHLPVPRLTTTRGSLYLFMPGLEALRTLGGLALDLAFTPALAAPASTGGAVAGAPAVDGPDLSLGGLVGEFVERALDIVEAPTGPPSVVATAASPSLDLPGGGSLLERLVRSELGRLSTGGLVEGLQASVSAPSDALADLSLAVEEFSAFAASWSADVLQLSGLFRAGLTESLLVRLVEALFAPKPQASGDVRGLGPLAENFDPTDPGFLANPYPKFAAFRKDHPVLWVPRHEAFWVFTHALVAEMYARPDHFLKMPPNSMLPRGLFTMEKGRHAQVRPLLDTAFAAVTVNARAIAQRAADDALAAVGGGCFDFVEAYARRVPRDVLFTIMGFPRGEWAEIDGLARTVMKYADHTLDAAQRFKGQKAGVKLALRLSALLLRPRSGTLLHRIAWLTLMGQLRLDEAVMTLLHFLLGGYLSTEFLLCTGTRNLLLDGRSAWQTLQARPGGPDPTQDADLLKAIEEMRRYDTPLGVIDRYAGHDGSDAGRRGVTLGGVFVPEGARLLGMLGSANRDESVFTPHADHFDITRVPSGQHLALGTGPRECIGLPLQKVVAPLALATLMQRMPRLRLLSPAQPPWLSDPYFRSFERLMVAPD